MYILPVHVAVVKFSYSISISRELPVNCVCQWWTTYLAMQSKQEAQGLGALLDKMEDNDHIKLDNIEV